MAKLSLKLTPEEINSKVFSGKDGGYDALEVDKYLDLVVNDYIAFDQYHLECVKMEKELTELRRTLNNYKAKLSEEEYERALLQEKLEAMTKNGSNLENIELLQRISLLEQELYKLGKDPSRIK